MTNTYEATTPGVIIQQYVLYYCPGRIMSEEIILPVDGRDKQEAARRAPDGGYAFTFFEQVETTVVDYGEEVKLTSDRRNFSGTYFIDAVKMSQEDVRSLPGDHETLLAHMRINNHKCVVRCNMGNFQYFDKGDKIVHTR